MKKLLIILSVAGMMVCSITQAQAASFTLLPTDDATLQDGTLYNRWDLWTINYTGHQGTTTSYLFLKFTASSDLQNTLVNESIASVSLELYPASLTGNPDIKMYYYNNDNWNETQGSMSTPVYDTANPIGEISPLPSTGDSFATSLDISPFLFDDNNVYSLVLNNIDPNSSSNAQFYSKTYQDPNGSDSYYGPKLFIETTAAVPEPMTLSLFGMGLAGFAVRRKRA